MKLRILGHAQGGAKPRNYRTLGVARQGCTVMCLTLLRDVSSRRATPKVL